jgi:cell division septation protein DedD
VLATAGLLVFGLGKLMFDFSGVLTWMLGLWLVSAAYIVPGLYANVWLYGHYNDRISDVLRQSSGVVDTIGRLTAVAPGPRRLGRQVLANVLVLVVLLMPVLATQDWQGLGERAWSKLASAVTPEAPTQQASAPQTSPQSSPSAPATQTASGRVDGAGALSPAAPAIASGVLTQAVAATLPAVPAPATPSARPVDDASTRPVVAFEPAFESTARSGRSGADVVPVTSFAANPVAAAPLNAPLPTPFSVPGASSASARGSAAPSADLVPLQPVPLPTARLQAPQAPQPATAPRRLQLAQADTAATPLGNRAGNGTSGVVTRSPAAAPTASAAPVPADGEKPQASARLRAASQAAQAKRATQSQGGTVTASAAPQSGVGAMPLSAPPATTPSPSLRPAGSPAWVVQAGVFRQADNAHRMVAQLQAMGIEAALENFPNSRGEPLLRVVVGPYAQQAQAQQAAQRIKARSLPAMVMREAR